MDRLEKIKKKLGKYLIKSKSDQNDVIIIKNDKNEEFITALYKIALENPDIIKNVSVIDRYKKKYENYQNLKELNQKLNEVFSKVNKNTETK
jgi:hypothetical protein